MRRRSFAWVVAAVLAVAGSQAAHAVSYAVVGGEGAGALLESTGHSYLDYLPLALGLATAAVVVALVSELRLATAGDLGRRPALWSFAALAPLLFIGQEHFERLLSTGVFPWAAATEPTFLLGLALQVPFGLLAYGAARVLVRAARALGRLLAAPRQRLRASAPVTWRPRVAAPLRTSVPALGYGTRGPPLTSAL